MHRLKDGREACLGYVGAAACILLLAATFGPNPARGEAYESESQREQGLLVLVPDAEGGEEAKESILRAVVESGLPYAIRVHRWGHPIPGMGPFENRTTAAGNRKAAKRLAEDIAAYQRSYPSRRVFLIGHQGGAAVVVLALEELALLQKAGPVAGAFLLSAHLSANYDPTGALAMTHLGMVNVYDDESAVVSGEDGSKRLDAGGGSGPLASRVGFARSHEKLFDYKLVREEEGTVASRDLVAAHSQLIAEEAPRWALSDTWPPEGEREEDMSQVLEPEPQESPSGEPVELLQKDPQAFLRMCLEHTSLYADCRCVFIKNERMDGKLTGEQVIDALYRRDPWSVYMKWKRNERGAKRVLWIEGRHRTRRGEEQLRVEPTGVARLLVSNALLALDDDRVVKDSRRPITEFGFKPTLEYICEDNERAAEEGVLDLQYEGTGIVDGRPTYILVRQLPYARRNPKYPDARMVLHIDQEWLVPLSIFCYADQEERTLLESYEIIKLRLNAGLTNQDFKF